MTAVRLADVAPSGDDRWPGWLATQRAVRRELEWLDRALARAEPYDSDELLARWDMVKWGLRFHAEEQDDEMAPLLCSRRDDLGPLMDRLAVDHHRLEALARLVDQHITERTDPREAVESVARLDALLLRHLGDEERHLIPAMSGVLDVAEERAHFARLLCRAGLVGLTSLVPWLIEDADAETADAVLGQLTPAQRRGEACLLCHKRWPRPRKPVARMPGDGFAMACEECA